MNARALREAAAAADRDANAEFPGSYYRKAHRARARRLRAKADRLERQHRPSSPEENAMRMTADQAGALRTLAAEGHGHAVTGDGPGELHPSWCQHLDRLAAAGLVDTYPENGTLADDPGRTVYEITEDGTAALASLYRRP